MQPETTDHLFWGCPIVTSFWNDATSLCIRGQYDISVSEAYFGKVSDISDPINFFIIHAKYFIFCCKCNKSKPDGHAFFYKFKFYREVEQYILNKRHNMERISHFNDTLYLKIDIIFILL